MNGDPSHAGFAGRGVWPSRLEWLLARRYLTTRSQSRFLNLITWIAVIGVALGVAALLLVVGVMTGMQREIRTTILGTYPHVMVMTYGEDLVMHEWGPALEATRRDPAVVEANPFVYSQGLVTAGGHFAQAVDVRGLATDTAGEILEALRARVLAGDLDLTRDGEPPPVALGYRLADRLIAYPGDTVTLVSPANAKLTSLGYVPEFRRYRVVALIKTGMFDFDSKFVYMALQDAQRFAGIGDAVTGVEARVRDPWTADVVAARLAADLGYPYRAVDWKATNESLFKALNLEKFVLGAIVLLIVVVAAFNIISTLVMVVTDKTREIGILRSMGMTSRRILRIFMLQGLTVGLVGTAVGAVVGITLAWLENHFGIVRIPPDVYFVDRLPVALDLADIATILAAAIVISFAATIYPSLQASRLTPVEAIRHD